jgi:cell division protein FtsB
MNINDESTERERNARRLLIMKRVLEILGWLTAVALFAFASHAVFAASGASAFEVAYTAEARDQRNGGGAQDDPASRPARVRKRDDEREDRSLTSIARDARTVYVAPSQHVERKYLEYKLGKYEELRDWNLMLVSDPSAADLIINVDKTALNYIFTVTDRRTSIIVATGKCIAVNGRLAAEYLGKEIVKKLKDARASGDGGRRKRHSHDDSDDDEWSES